MSCMKIQTQCVPCLIKRIIFETEQSTDDQKKRTKVIKNTCKALSELYDPDETSAVIATKVHKIAYDTLGDNDPYKKLKDESNKIAKKLLPLVGRLIKKSDNPLRTAMICSIVGNMMDFGIEGASENPKDLKDIFEKTVKEDLGYDDSEKLKKLLEKSRNIMLFTDNCGEIVFDKELCRQLKHFYPSIHLTVVVRGEPIISDATIEDAHELKFEEVADEILTTGCFAIGVDFMKMPEKLSESLDNADLIICKGMANYEAFSETNYQPIAYLLRTKCSAIANSMKLPQNNNVIKLY